MQWSDLFVRTADLKVARRLASAGDLQSFTGQVALGRAPDAVPDLAGHDGVWVSTEPMPETVKDVGDDGLVRATVPRDGLSIARFPVVVPADLLAEATDPDDLLRRAIARSRVNRLEADQNCT